MLPGRGPKKRGCDSEILISLPRLYGGYCWADLFILDSSAARSFTPPPDPARRRAVSRRRARLTASANELWYVSANIRTRINVIRSYHVDPGSNIGTYIP